MTEEWVGDPTHIVPLNRYAAALRARHGDVPRFDSLDGGIDARVLVLLETPGPASASTEISTPLVLRRQLKSDALRQPPPANGSFSTTVALVSSHAFQLVSSG